MSTNRIHWLCDTLLMTYFLSFAGCPWGKFVTCLLIIMFINIYSYCYVLKLLHFLFNSQYLFYVLVDDVQRRTFRLHLQTQQVKFSSVAFKGEIFLSKAFFCFLFFTSNNKRWWEGRAGEKGSRRSLEGKRLFVGALQLSAFVSVEKTLFCFPPDDKRCCCFTNSIIEL